jgi:hypothetical protein
VSNRYLALMPDIVSRAGVLMHRKTKSRKRATSYPSLMRLAIIIFALTLTAHAQWDIEESHTTASLRGIHNVGGGVVWASGTNGTVLRSEDGGYLWQTCTTPPDAEKLDFRGIQAFDENTAIVMSSGPGDQSRLYKTTDGCQTWRLLFTNPDKEGFWDTIQFSYNAPSFWKKHPNTKLSGVLLGDPVGGKLVIYTIGDSGETWQSWGPPNTHHPVKVETGESLFATSNSVAVVPGINGQFDFVTGGASGSHLFVANYHMPFDTGFWWAFSKIRLPFARGESSGAFSVAARRACDICPPDLMIVGGDYKKPEQRNVNSIYIPYNAPLDNVVSWDKGLITSQTPPHGYRSAVAYDLQQKLWITVGPNGTDISTDDGRNWRALKPGPTDPPDADKNWNALSLPFVVGPNGRIGRLRTINPNEQPERKQAQPPKSP